MKRKIEELKETNNKSVFKKLYRHYLSFYGSKGVGCSRCKPHRNENWTRRIKRNWKKFRKTRYKI